MSTTLNPSATCPSGHLSWPDAWCRARILNGLREHGCQVAAEEAEGEEFIRIAPPGHTSLQACLRVHHPRFYRRLLLGADIGAAEAYLDGDWSTPDLTEVLRVGARLQSAWNALYSPGVAMRRLALRMAARFRRNSRTGSRRNIAAHYDLSNDFFSQFLDETLTYSAAYFETPDTPLLHASLAKLDRICQKLAIQPGDHVLEVGTGWGSLALHAARNYGCRVTTTTLSAEQHALASARVRDAGLQDRVSVLQRDYRALEGTHDKLVSIEMIEAVGHEFLDTFFRTCGERLKDNGLALIQAISSRDQDYPRARKEIDFIKKFIFPGGCLTSISAMIQSMTRATDMQLFGLEDFTPHYALTLRHWRENFVRNAERIRALGFDARFMRMWTYYLCYCEAGFAERNVGVAQLLFAKPGYRARVGAYLERIPAPESFHESCH